MEPVHHQVFVDAPRVMQEMSANTLFAMENIQMILMSAMVKEHVKIQMAVLVIQGTLEITVKFQNALN
jgi:hypothetical protein